MDWFTVATSLSRLMTGVACNISEQSVIIQGNSVTCDTGTTMAVSAVSVQGISTSNSIYVKDSDTILAFDEVSIINAVDSPVRVEGSTVRLILMEANALMSGDSAGVLCLGGSNVTLLGGDAAGSADIEGSARYPGVGPGPGDECGTLGIENGSSRTVCCKNKRIRFVFLSSLLPYASDREILKDGLSLKVSASWFDADS
jgi:hypothetical protein